MTTKSKPRPHRRADQQRIHDLVIASLAEQYSRRGYLLHANPNQQKNHAFAGMYPDVVVMAKSSQRPLLVVEVETEDSVRDSEAALQWVEYDGRYGMWTLAVPAHVRRAAKALIEAHELQNVRLVTWSIDFAGLPK